MHIMIGAKLYICNSENHCIDEVISETKTDWITKNNRKIVKSTLFVRETSKKWNKTSVFIAEQKHYDRIERDSLINKYGLKFRFISIEGLRQIDKIYNENEITAEEKQRLSFGSCNILNKM